MGFGAWPLEVGHNVFGMKGSSLQGPKSAGLKGSGYWVSRALLGLTVSKGTANLGRRLRPPNGALSIYVPQLLSKKLSQPKDLGLKDLGLKVEHLRTLCPGRVPGEAAERMMTGRSALQAMVHGATECRL